MRTIQEITFGVSGQTVYFDCPEGRPSSVTSAELFYWDAADTDTSLDSFLGAPSIEANPDTTVSADSGDGQADPRILSIAATTGLEVDRTYLVTSADGYREWFDVEEIGADSVTARHPLHNGYTSGDTVQTTRIQATIDSDWVANLDYLVDNGPNPSYRVRWLYTVGGVQHVADTYFKLVRYTGQHGVRPQDVEAVAPGWMDRLPTDHREDQGRRLIDEAFRSVKLDLHKVWTDETMVAESEVLDELTRYKALVMSEFGLILQGTGSSDAYTAAKAAYQDRLDSFVRVTTKVPVRDTSGAARNVPAPGLSRR